MTREHLATIAFVLLVARPITSLVLWAVYRGRVVS